MPSIRVLAICVFRRGPRILVARGFDDVKSEYFLRPLGGQVELGESAEQALRRELREEISAEIETPTRLDFVENRFAYRGWASHEIVFVFDARFADASLYEAESIPINEDVWEGPARWVDLREPGSEPIYPDGLVSLLARKANPD